MDWMPKTLRKWHAYTPRYLAFAVAIILGCIAATVWAWSTGFFPVGFLATLTFIPTAAMIVSDLATPLPPDKEEEFRRYLEKEQH